MAILDLKEGLRELSSVSRVGELADGVLLLQGNPSVLLIHGGTVNLNRNNRYVDSQIEVIQDEFEQVDYVIASIEGAVLAIQESATTYTISYFPEYLGLTNPRKLEAVVRRLSEGTIEIEQLSKDYLSEEEQIDPIALLNGALEANLTTYHTPPKVAEIAVNWATSDGRSSVVDVSCGSGQFLTAAVDATGEPTQAWGIDQNALACELTATRTRIQNVPREHILCRDFFELTEELSLNSQATLSQIEGEPSREFPTEGFDCVIAHPPAGTSQSEQSQHESTDQPFRRVEHQFISAACRMLAEGGRGSFILPSHGLRALRERVVPDDVVIKRLIKLPERVFPVVGVSPILVCVERTPHDTGLGILNISQFDDLERISGAVHSPAAADSLASTDAVEVNTDTQTSTVQMLLSAPGAAPFFTGTLPSLEDITENIASGMVTGNNEVFYFTESEKYSSDIDDQFFTPVIKSVPEEGPEISEDDIDIYLFDLREFVQDTGIDKRDFTAISEELSSTDGAAASYVDDELRPAVSKSSRSTGVLPRSIPMVNPDLVVGEITSPVTWHIVDVGGHEVLYDNSVVGLKCSEQASPETLITLLNTPLYQRINKKYLKNFDAEYVRVQIRPLRNLPMITQQVSEDTLEQLRALRPYKSQESQNNARIALLEGIGQPTSSTVAAIYDAVSPLSTLEDYEDQIGQLRRALADSEADMPSDQLVDETMTHRLEETFRAVELFNPRKSLVNELLAVYSDERFWSFLGGTASQFEGMLQDYVEVTGGQVEERRNQEGDTRLEFRYRDDWKPLRLKTLLDHFFSGELLEVMQGVRKQRNEIAHGRLVRKPEQKADMMLLAFFVFTYALLQRYNEYLGAEKTTR